jgi:hypothetical protein
VAFHAFGDLGEFLAPELQEMRSGAMGFERRIIFYIARRS